MNFFNASISDLCQGIIDKTVDKERRIEYLEEENKKLKDEHYKDSEMQKMKTELKIAKEDLYRGFPISEKEQKKIGSFFRQLDNLITLHQRKPFLMKWRNSDANRNQTNRLVL